jgi:hypothetical protein
MTAVTPQWSLKIIPISNIINFITVQCKINGLKIGDLKWVWSCPT